MSRHYDINFKLDNGKEYGFMLARKDGKKAWNCNYQFFAPPDLRKYRIDITVTAREDDITATGVRQLKRVEEIISDMDKIMAETTAMTLTGLDGRDYSVLVDKSGILINTIIHEKAREPEYQVSLLLWGLYE